jgi:hypothetical protein
VTSVIPSDVWHRIQAFLIPPRRVTLIYTYSNLYSITIRKRYYYYTAKFHQDNFILQLRQPHQVIMSTIIRPQALLRASTIHSPHPLFTTLNLASSSRRCLSTSLSRNAPPKGVRHNSTALDKDVKEREERNTPDSAVVGGAGKGAEGVHFQGQSSLFMLCRL